MFFDKKTKIKDFLLCTESVYSMIGFTLLLVADKLIIKMVDTTTTVHLVINDRFFTFYLPNKPNSYVNVFPIKPNSYVNVFSNFISVHILFNFPLLLKKERKSRPDMLREFREFSR